MFAEDLHHLVCSFLLAHSLTLGFVSNFLERHERATLRQTQVLVIPSNKDMLSFPVFDSLIFAINEARRNARDYVTDVSLDRLDEKMYGDGDRDWWYVSSFSK